MVRRQGTSLNLRLESYNILFFELLELDSLVHYTSTSASKQVKGEEDSWKWDEYLVICDIFL